MSFLLRSVLSYVKFFRETISTLFHRASIDRTFIRNFSKLILGTGSSQLVGILTVPILTRLYGVEAYGTQAYYFSIVGIFVIFATGKYENAILLPEDDKESFAICCFTIILSTALSIFGGIVYALLKEKIFFFHGSIEIFYWLQWLPVTVFAITLFLVFTIYLNRMRDYGMMAKSGVLVSLFNFLASFSYAILYPGDSFGLYFNTFAGQLLISIILFFYCYSKKYFYWKWISLKYMFEAAKKYANMPKYMICGGVLNDLSSRLPVFFLQSFAGEMVVGWYAMGLKLLGLPIQMITQSVGKVFMRDAVEELNEKKHCWISFKKTFLTLILMGIIPFFVIQLYAIDMFTMYLGSQWYMAGVYCIYLLPMYFIEFVFSPLSTVLILASRQKVFLYLQVCRILVVGLFLKIGYIFFETADAVIISFGVGFSIYYIAALVYCGKVAHKNYRDV